MLRHRHGGGIGQLVAGAHHEGIEGELSGGEPLVLVGLGAAPLKLRQFVGIQDPDVELYGEDVQQYGLDVLYKQGFDISFLKVVGAV